MIKAVQTSLGLTADGVAGPLTWVAIQKKCGVVVPIDSSRSERNIATLNPVVQPLARELIALAAKNGIEIVVTSGLRTYKQQDELYAQGRTTSGPIVTRASGGHSNHNFGVAFDVTEFRQGLPIYESRNYAVVGILGKSIGLSWGGDWGVPDEPHFELRPGWASNISESMMLSEFRRRNDMGVDLLT